MINMNEDVSWIEAGKLKHKRIISITTLLATIFGGMIVGLIFNPPAEADIPFNKNWLVLSLSVFIVSVLAYQNHRLNKLELILGWQTKDEEGHLNPVAKILEEYSIKIGELSFLPKIVILGIFILISFTAGVILGIYNIAIEIQIIAILILASVMTILFEKTITKFTGNY